MIESTKIIQVLLLSTDAHALILLYVCTVKPSLVEPYKIDVYVIALAHHSLPVPEDISGRRRYEGRLVRNI
jgi:hypothetical protein